jgi:tetratricopeptide (TPR) repeat protein
MNPAPGIARFAAPALCGGWLILAAWGARVDGQRPPAADTDPDSALGRLWGGARGQASQQMVQRADVYFHRGADHEMPEGRRFLFGRWREAAHPPAGHHHRESPESVAEILPWLRAATVADPSNLESILLAAYWMERATGEIGGAEEILRAALPRHGGDYRLPLELARLKFRHGDLDEGRTRLDAAIAAWPAPFAPDDHEARRDAAYLWHLRGLLAAYEGDAEAAAAALEIAITRGGEVFRAGALRDLAHLREHPDTLLRDPHVLARFVRLPCVACEEEHDHDHH